MAKDWTPEQKDNAMKYALCWVCGAPRERKRTVETVDGKKVYWQGIVCPNGHPQG